MPLPGTMLHPVLILSSAGVPAMLMKRWEKMESWTVLSSVPRMQLRSEPTVRQTSPDSVKQASQFGSTRMVLIENRARVKKIVISMKTTYN